MTKKSETFKELMNRAEGNLFSLLFKAKEDAHITHLMQPTQSYSDHIALNIFYDEMDDLTDKLVEMYYGINGPNNEPIKFTSKVIEEPLSSYFRSLLKNIQNKRIKYTEAYMTAQLDEIEMLISRTIYRLENTRSNV